MTAAWGLAPAAVSVHWMHLAQGGAPSAFFVALTLVPPIMAAICIVGIWKLRNRRQPSNVVSVGSALVLVMTLLGLYCHRTCGDAIGAGLLLHFFLPFAQFMGMVIVFAVAAISTSSESPKEGPAEK